MNKQQYFDMVAKKGIMKKAIDGLFQAECELVWIDDSMMERVENERRHLMAMVEELDKEMAEARKAFSKEELSAMAKEYRGGQA